MCEQYCHGGKGNKIALFDQMPSVGWIRYNAQAKQLTVMVGKEMAAVFNKNAISVPIFSDSYLRNLTGLGNGRWTDLPDCPKSPNVTLLPITQCVFKG